MANKAWITNKTDRRSKIYKSLHEQLAREIASQAPCPVTYSGFDSKNDRKRKASQQFRATGE